MSCTLYSEMNILRAYAKVAKVNAKVEEVLRRYCECLGRVSHTYR